MVVMAAMHDCSFELVEHPSYSHGLAPSDYMLFPNMIFFLLLLGGSIGPMMRTYLQDLFEDQDTTGKHRWKKYVDSRRDYMHVKI